MRDMEGTGWMDDIKKDTVKQNMLLNLKLVK